MSAPPKPPTYLNFSVKMLKFLNLWTEKDTKKSRLLKDSYVILSVMPSVIAVGADFIIQLIDGAENMSTLIENLIALIPIIGMIYMVICFIQNRSLIRHLIYSIDDFNVFGRSPELQKTDDTANIYSKFFIFYGLLGNIIYVTMPFLNLQKCREARTTQMIEQGIPCGLITRVRYPFKIDYTPIFEMLLVHQFYSCSMITLVILVLTMLLCGVLMHIRNQLNYLRTLIRNWNNDDTNRVAATLEEVHFIVRYHIAIIKFYKDTNAAFGSMLLLYLTLTSLEISVLGFQVLIVDNYTDSLRYVLHLFGWLVLLLLVCYYSQLLIDESIEVARDIYFTPWFKTCAAVQRDIKMIIMRAQKPLAVSALNLGVMSLATYLNVLSSAYSYFTLLLKLKS